MVAINLEIDSTQEAPRDSLVKLATYQVLAAAELDELERERDCWLVHDFIEQRKPDFRREYLDVDIYLTWSYNQPRRLQTFQLYRCHG